ncbi:MAG: 1,4-alpha-glucan branching protein GlgB [Lachnospiraceae bacterium]|nr:1,4-alpha-glucan branching protein GlgB [Lachnospiraceae bacterium]
MELGDFFAGKAMDAYTFFGAHPTGKGTVFRVYARNAAGVTVMGDWTGWNEIPMDREQGGIFTKWEEYAYPGHIYKYVVYGRDGSRTERCDPYGFGSELRPKSGSVIRELDSYQFGDWEWMNGRSAGYDRPVNIYEVHAGSWKRRSDEDENGFYTYTELADRLIPYVKEMGYTHVEFLPLSEHPCDASWGYQNTGFYAPTSRYGTPDELRSMIDRFHQAGIGVILDIVPAHFAVDGYGLWKFDGTPLYEYNSPDVANSEWGTYNFDYSKGEVRSFMQSCANYWLKEFHFDGLRLDAVSRLIFWQGNERRGVNPNSLNFLKYMNENLKRLHPTCMLIAEDSTAYPGVTRATWAGGLGFDYKWDLGWMHDTLSYMQTGAWLRGSIYHKLTFSMMYFFAERYLLPLSHDEVVHGKATILQRMQGDYETKFPQARLLYLYMAAHPGKKLNFMGNEFGQLREWDEEREQDWMLLQYPKHDSFRAYIKDLNRLLITDDAFFRDYPGDGFLWRDCNSQEQCLYAIERRGETSRVLCVMNFSGIEQTYCLPLYGERAELLLDTDDVRFGGNTERTDFQQDACEITIHMPAYTGMLFALGMAEDKE